MEIVFSVVTQTDLYGVFFPAHLLFLNTLLFFCEKNVTSSPLRRSLRNAQLLDASELLRQLLGAWDGLAELALESAWNTWQRHQPLGLSTFNIKKNGGMDFLGMEMYM